MADLRITILAALGLLAMAGCGMPDPVGVSDRGGNASGDLVDQAGNTAAPKRGDGSDRAALTALYEAAGGKNWIRQDKWLTDAPLADWYGVWVGSRYMGDAHGRVVGLALPANNLAGTIPPELGNLAHLEDLWLSENDLSGKIPASLGKLKELYDLRLDRNQLTGSIPSELGNLSWLKWLELQHNRLTGKIPPELGDIGYVNRVGWRRTLVVLSLAGNRLRGTIPPELGKLVDLQEMALDDNRLTGEIPVELGNLKELEELNLAGNRLAGKIPPELGWIRNLKELVLRGNRLTGRIPPQFFVSNRRGSCIRVVDLGQNRLRGAIPAEVGRYTCLRDFWLDGNRLTGKLPASLLDHHWFREFHFGNNRSACAPNTDAFVDWLDGIESWSGPFCDEVG